MRVVFFGTSAFAVPSLEALSASSHQIVACVTQPDRPQGRGLKPQASPVNTAAQRLGLRCEEPADLRATGGRLKPLAPDVGIVVAYGRLIPHQLLTLSRDGMVGLHPSLLPHYRGASPIAWAILNGEVVSGVTTFRLGDRLDAGDIAMQQGVALSPSETTATLSERLAALGGVLLVKTLTALEQGTLRFQPQDEAAATYARKLVKDDGRIDWNASAMSIERLVRAMNPWPGAWTTWQGQRLKLWAIGYNTPLPASAGPGTVLAIESDGIVVATAAGQAILRELQLAGGRRMPARDFLRGHDLRVGELLGKADDG